MHPPVQSMETPHCQWVNHPSPFHGASQHQAYQAQRWARWQAQRPYQQLEESRRCNARLGMQLGCSLQPGGCWLCWAQIFFGGIKAVYWTSILTHNLGWQRTCQGQISYSMLQYSTYSLTSSPFPTDRLWQVARNNGGGGMGTKMRLSFGAKAVTSSGRENARPMASQTARHVALRWWSQASNWSPGHRSSQGCANLRNIPSGILT